MDNREWVWGKAQPVPTPISLVLFGVVKMRKGVQKMRMGRYRQMNWGKQPVGRIVAGTENGLMGPRKGC